MILPASFWDYGRRKNSLQIKKQLYNEITSLKCCTLWFRKLDAERSWYRKITAFKLWAWRKILRASWTERKSNTWVRQTVGVPEDQGLLAQLKKRKLAVYEHWKRRPDSIVLATIEREVEGKARPGRRRTAWIDNIGAWTNGGLGASTENARRRMPTVLWRILKHLRMFVQSHWILPVWYETI